MSPVTRIRAEKARVRLATCTPRDAAVALGFLSGEEYDRLVDPTKMTGAFDLPVRSGPSASPDLSGSNNNRCGTRVEGGAAIARRPAGF